MNLKEFQETDWYKERPEIIRNTIDNYPPMHIYKFKDSKKEFHIMGYTEPEEGDEIQEVTLIVQKTGQGGVMNELGLGVFDTNQVFGVRLDSIEFA